MENLLVSTAKMRRAFANGAPSGPGQSRDAAVAREGQNDEAREASMVREESDTAREERMMASYKDGTAYVPKTGLAILHKGEAVIPAKKNKSLFDAVHAPCVSIRVAASGGWIVSIAAVNDELNGEHIVSAALLSKMKAAIDDPQAFFAILDKAFAGDTETKNEDTAVVAAKANPSESVEKVVKKTPTETDRAAGRLTNQPMPATATKASA